MKHQLKNHSEMYVLVTEMGGIRQYLRSTSTRWDNKRLPNLTKELSEAKTFPNEQDAQHQHNMLFTHRHFFIEPVMKPAK